LSWLVQPVREVPGVFLERIIQDLHEYVHGSVAELVFNLDEVGISDLEDRKRRKLSSPTRCLARGYIMRYLEI
jgi:hypothetical protein